MEQENGGFDLKTGKEFTNYLAMVADDKRARNIVILDMHGISTMADYFIICHGTSEKNLAMSCSIAANSAFSLSTP